MTFRSVSLMTMFMLCLLTPVRAHEVLHSLSEGGAAIVELTYGDGSPFSFESYELFRPGESIPAQVGRTDHRGRIVFIPDVSGGWRIRAFSEDGHGADFTVNTDVKNLPIQAGSRSLRQYEKILIGVGCILGIFGIISMGYRRRRV